MRASPTSEEAEALTEISASHLFAELNVTEAAGKGGGQNHNGKETECDERESFHKHTRNTSQKPQKLSFILICRHHRKRIAEMRRDETRPREKVSSSLQAASSSIQT